jgi:membrane carboxypeptidase/penicillin-binding protein
MKTSRFWALGLLPALLMTGLGTVHAAALDVPHSLHRSRASAPHLSETRRHHAAAPARKSTAHAGKGHVAAKAATAGRRATLAPRGAAAATARRASLTSHRHKFYERFTASSFASGDIFAGDVTGGEDPVVRQAAIDALGDMNGTAVVIDPSNGRILAMVNQKLALSPGAEPCSTIKITVAMAALSEGIVTRDTMVQLPGFRMNMTDALAKSNNLYFEELGRELGFDRVRHYATQFGLGELAGYNIEGEQLGVYPDQELPASEGGVGRMCSFGQGVSLTPLQLGAYVAALANGGTLYYLQHPTSQDEVASLQPRVKRTLDIAKYVPEMQDGMAGAVEYGTARRLRANFHDFPVFGKTGTCSDHGTRFGWFASYSESPQGSLVTVFFLEGGRPTFGPRAAELTGEFYKNLADRNYFAPKAPQEAQITQVVAPAEPADLELSTAQASSQTAPK